MPQEFVHFEKSSCETETCWGLKIVFRSDSKRLRCEKKGVTEKESTAENEVRLNCCRALTPCITSWQYQPENAPLVLDR